MKTVLIVEDDNYMVVTYRNRLRDYSVEILDTSSVDGALAMFEQHPGVEVIVMDGCLFAHQPNTLELIREIRKRGYKGPMIANSSDFNRWLKEAGCDHECKDEQKSNIPAQLIELLQLQPK